MQKRPVRFGGRPGECMVFSVPLLPSFCFWGLLILRCVASIVISCNVMVPDSMTKTSFALMMSICETIC